MATKLTQKTDVDLDALKKPKKKIEVGSQDGLKSDDREAKKLEQKLNQTFAYRLQHAEGGEWMRYPKALAEKFGKAYKITILPVEYPFQVGQRTFILDEHVKHILAVFDETIRAQGMDITTNDLFGDADPTKMIKGTGL